MDARLKELLEKEILTGDEVEEVECHEEVTEINVMGYSSRYPEYNWFDVKTSDGQEFDVYCKY